MDILAGNDNNTTNKDTNTTIIMYNDDNNFDKNLDSNLILNHKYHLKSDANEQEEINMKRVCHHMMTNQYNHYHHKKKQEQHIMMFQNDYDNLVHSSETNQPLFNQVIEELSKKFQQVVHPNYQQTLTTMNSSQNTTNTIMNSCSSNNTCLDLEAISTSQCLIHYAAINNDLDLMKKLLLKNNIHDHNDGNDDKNILNELIDSRDSELNTPLLVAASNGHREMVRFLLNNGANVNAQNYFDNTSLHEAAWRGFSETLGILCNHHRLQPDATNGNLKLHLKNKQGHTALHLAAQKGHNQSTRVLILAGCRPNVKNNFGDTPLHSASRYGHVGVVRILISGFANVNELNKNDDTALHIASAMNRKKLAKILLENSCNPTIVNRQGETPMNIALRKSYFDIQELIASPPPLKSLYQNHHLDEGRKSNELWPLVMIKNDSHHSRYPKHMMMKTKFDTYSCDQLNKCYYSAYRYHHHGRCEDNRQYPDNYAENLPNELKRCKSDFSTHHHKTAKTKYLDQNEQVMASLLSRIRTPTTQASSIEYKKKKKKNKDSHKRRIISPRRYNSGKYSDIDDSEDGEDGENSYNYNEDHDHKKESEYCHHYTSSWHHRRDHYHRHHRDSSEYCYRDHHESLAIPKLDTLPMEPLKKGEKYFMDLSGHMYKGPINDVQQKQSKNQKYKKL